MTNETDQIAKNPLLGYLTTVALVSGGLVAISGTGSNITPPRIERSDIRGEKSGLEFSSLIVRNSYTGTSSFVSQISRNTVTQATATKQPSSAELVKQVHTDSGLTWEQLAKVFGVSRRALHQWASGGRLNSANLEKLSSFSRNLSELNASSPAERRSALFAPDNSGKTIYDRLRAAQASSAITISEPLWRMDSLAGGRPSV